MKFLKLKTNFLMFNCLKINSKEWKDSSLLWRANWWLMVTDQTNLLEDSPLETIWAPIIWEEIVLFDLEANKVFWHVQAQMQFFPTIFTTKRMSLVNRKIKNASSVRWTSMEAKKIWMPTEVMIMTNKLKACMLRWILLIFAMKRSKHWLKT